MSEDLNKKYMENINSPASLKELSLDELPEYCKELREFIVSSLASNPGHLASSLGVVELTTALHYVFNTPDDKLIWDVGHQAYAHKIITGRGERFHTNRKLGGLSGFPKMSESPYDAFGAGHASISISAALGMATASKIEGKDNKVVAIIGDGAMTGGLAFEGLNNAGSSGTDLLVILNDNHMAIAPNTGALTDYLLGMTTSKRYNKFKNKLWNGLGFAPRFRRLLQNTANTLKQGLLQQSNLFESLNFRYFGPVDGNDVKAMTKVLRNLKEIKGPKLLHVITVKGKGYLPAEKDQSLWHAPGKFDAKTGDRINSSKPQQGELYQEVFGRTLCDLAKENKKIVGITPAMPLGCSMNYMMDAFPDRCFDVGIAEAHAVTFSAGLAAEGMLPFCNIYSSFMQRAYDNIIHDVAIQNLPVVMCLDRAGLVGEDGATHHGAYDLAALRAIPNLVIAAPMNESELRNLMFTATKANRPFIIRYPRGKSSGEGTNQEFSELEIGTSRVVSQGQDLAILSLGHVGNFAKDAIARAEQEGISITHIDLRYAKPLDKKMLSEIGAKFKKIITIEDGCLQGGVGEAINAYFISQNINTKAVNLGIKDEFIEQGSMSELQKLCEIDAEGIYKAIKSL
ncbi:MAG: 1-deoxy-D-xylulose-5-phosphate synthase [Rikenellaceae bacterium]